MAMKKILALTMFSGILALTGCGLNQTGGGIVGGYEDIDNWTKNETGTLNFDSSGHVIYNNVEINIFSIVQGSDKKGLEDIIFDFNNLYNGKIKVTLETEGQGTYETSLVTRISTGVGVPDIAMFHNENLPSLQRSHLFQPIDRVIEKANIDLKASDFPEGVMKNNIIANKLFGVSIDGHSEVMLYRKDLLEKYHLTFPKNFDEFINAAYTIQEGERKEGNVDFQGLSLAPGCFGNYQYTWYTSILQNGGTLLDPETARPNWNVGDNKNAFLTAAQEFKDIFYGPKAIAPYGDTETQPDTKFATGKCAFSFNYTWCLKDIFRTFDYKFDEEARGIANLSSIFAKDNTKSYANDIFTISHGFFVPYNVTDINKKAAAVEFMKYFTEHSVKWNDWGHVPTNINYVRSPEYTQSEATQQRTKYFGEIQNFRNFPYNYFLSVATSNLTNIFTFVTNNQSSDISSLLDRYTTDANDLIDMLIG